jgi:hypothetical protein
MWPTFHGNCCIDHRVVAHNSRVEGVYTCKPTHLGDYTALDTRLLRSLREIAASISCLNAVVTNDLKWIHRLCRWRVYPFVKFNLRNYQIVFDYIFGALQQWILNEPDSSSYPEAIQSKPYFTRYSNQLVTGYCYGVVSYKAFHALRPFSDILCSPSEFLSLLIYSQELSGKYQRRHLVAKQVKTCREISINFARRNISLILRRDL